jgi:hypothetical protein
MRISALLRSKSFEDFESTIWLESGGSISVRKAMTIHISPWLLGRKWILITVGLPILVTLWWAFRPEKLWINQKVDEPAPFDASGDSQPIFTGRFEGNIQQTRGRATIYKKPGDDEYLRLNDFTTESGPDAHVVLARRDDTSLTQGVIDLGPLKGNQGDQIYDLPAATDLSKYDAVAIYGKGAKTVLGRAVLEPF